MNTNKTKTVTLLYLSEQTTTPEIKTVTKELKSYQDLVSGLIEPVILEDYTDDERIKDLTLWVNEEGLLLHMLPNLAIDEETVLVGPMFISSTNCDDGSIDSIPESRINDVIEYLNDHLYINEKRETNMLSTVLGK